LPGDVKGLQAEWAAARPFVIALRTGAENKLLTAQEFIVCSERDQKAAFSVFADQKFFQAGNPLANRPFTRAGFKTLFRPFRINDLDWSKGVSKWLPVMRDAEDSPEFEIRPRTRRLLTEIKFNSVERVRPGKLENQGAPANHGIRPHVKVPRLHSYMEREPAWVQCREVRTNSHVLPCGSRLLRTPHRIRPSPVV
jgi:hypothetical protein